MSRAGRSDGDLTKSKILDAAGRLIAQDGFAKTTSKAIAKLAAYYGITTDALLGVSPAQSDKIHHLAQLFSTPDSVRAAQMFEQMLSAGYSETQIQRFIEIADALSGMKKRP